jgi:hypothetical protein
MNRNVARLVWASTLVVPIFFAAVAETVRWGKVHLPESQLLFWLTVVTSVACIVLSRMLPPRIRPIPAGPEATAFVRLVSGWALCEGAALFPLVIWILTNDGHLLLVCAVDLLALLLLYPSPARWNRLLPGGASPEAR